MNLCIDKNLSIAMRDGVTLATDVYRPAEGQPVPAIVLRLPYTKETPVLLFLSGDIFRVAPDVSGLGPVDRPAFVKGWHPAALHNLDVEPREALERCRVGLRGRRDM